MAKFRPIIVWVALIITLGINFLSQSPSVVSLTVADIANKYPIYFLPANYVFSIWGIIYTGLIAYAIYQTLPAQRKNPVFDTLAVLFLITCVANSVWLVLFLNLQFALSPVAMLVLLGTLIVIYQWLKINQKPVSGPMRWAVHVPFSIYLGWITVATVANVTYVLYDAKWDGLGIAPTTWAVIMMAAAGVITLAMIFTRRDIAYTLVVAWALIGIVVRYSGVTTVAVGAIAVTVIILGALILAWTNRLRGTRSSGPAVNPA